MRSTIIPAQITTVEDTIAGTLTIKQLVLLVNPVVLAILFYMVIPPFFQFSFLKILLASLYAVCSLVLAIKVKERLVCEWLQVFSVYVMRPKYFVYDKNTRLYREKSSVSKKVVIEKENASRNDLSHDFPSALSFIDKLATHSQFQVSVKPVRKGGFKVAVYEIHR